MASLALTSYGGAQKQARDTQRRSDLGQYRNGLESYASVNNGLYPSHASKYGAVNLCDVDLVEFLSDCPEDPLSDTQVYYYLSYESSTKYILYANLETTGWWYVCSTGKSNTTPVDEPTSALCP